MSDNLIENFKRVKAFIFDIDGVLTNGQVLVTEEGYVNSSEDSPHKADPIASCMPSRS